MREGQAKDQAAHKQSVRFRPKPAVSEVSSQCLQSIEG